MNEKNLCGAKTRAGTPCRKPAGAGTDHVGIGKCKLHGGKSPVKHGLYSKYTNHRLADMIDKLAQDESLLDLRQTIAAQQALIIDILNQLESGDLEYDPRLAEVVAGIADKLGRNTERHFKITEGEKYILQIEEVQKVVEQVVLIVREEVKDPATAQRIGARLQQGVKW